MNDTISKYDLMSVCTVSRETIDRLEVYAGLLERWNSTINLVSKNTINQINPTNPTNPINPIHFARMAFTAPYLRAKIIGFI